MDRILNAAEIVGADQTGEKATLLRDYRKAISEIQADELILKNVKIEKDRILRLQFGSTKLGIDMSVYDKKHIIAIGKAGLKMAEAFGSILKGRNLESCVAVIPEGSAPQVSETVTIFEGSHPSLSEKSLVATEAVIKVLRKVGPDDLVFFLISGGASAMFEQPAIPTGDAIATYEALLNCGADIETVNTIRKHLSKTKGGQLIYLTNGAQVYGLILSDIVGDPMEHIGSGITVPDSTTFEEAKEAVKRAGLGKKLPKSAIDRIKEGAKLQIPDTPKPNNHIFDAVTNVIVGSNRLACEAVAREAKLEGRKCYNLGSTFTGDASEVAINMAAFFRQLATTGLEGFEDEITIVFGGECPVKVTGNGMGGRMHHMAAEMLRELKGTPGVTVICATTDGMDAKTGVAAIIFGEDTYKEAKKQNLDIDELIRDNDTYNLFNRLPGTQVKTGPLGTNVSDIFIARIIRKKPSS